MKQAFAALAIALAGATPGLCAELEIPFPYAADRIAVPAQSPVHFSGFSKKYGDEQIATFPGKFLLTGTYYYGDNDFNDSGDQNPAQYVFDPEVYVVPDATMAARLPHFVERNRRQVIFLNNPEAFARAVVPEETARRVRCRTCGVAAGHIAIWVDQFTAGVVCDKPDYEAHFLSVDGPAKMALVPRPDRAC